MNTWQRLAAESTISHMLSELLSTKEGWLLLAVVLLGVPGMAYGALLQRGRPEALGGPWVPG